jgi:type IV pilus assembly protein PilA
MKSLRKGFTLVELMVVIVIIGILAALAIPRFLGATNKSKVAEFKPVLKQIYTLEEAFRQESNAGNYGELTAIGWDPPNPVHPENQFFVYGLTNAVYATQGAATAAGLPVPAVPATATATVLVAAATPQAGTGQLIKTTSGAYLTTADQACVNSNGEEHALGANAQGIASLTGATASFATTAATCIGPN